MKTLIIIILIVFTGIFTFAQNCTAFIPGNTETQLKFSNMNAKGKVESYQMQQVIDISQQDDAQAFTILSITYDAKNQDKIIQQDTMYFKCKGVEFIIDMEQYMDPSQNQEQSEDVSINISSSEISYPAHMQANQKLNDGFIKLEISTGPVVITNTTEISNREVEAHEEITTPAGNFTCYRISQDISNKTGFITIKFHTIEWITEDIGTIRSETYNKKGKLQSVKELVEIN